MMFFNMGIWIKNSDHIKVVEELFSAARAEFRQLEYFLFITASMKNIWKDDHHRAGDDATYDVLHKIGHDYKVHVVGNTQ